MAIRKAVGKAVEEATGKEVEKYEKDNLERHADAISKPATPEERHKIVQE